MNKKEYDFFTAELTKAEIKEANLIALAAWVREKQRCKDRIRQADKEINRLLSEISQN